MLLALCGSRTAFAGGTGTSTGGETSEGSSGADSSSSETTEGECETCPPSTTAGNIEFSDLDHGNPPAGERVVEVTAAQKCSCSECMCFDDIPTQIRLELDGDAVGEPCPSAQCEFVVVLTPGSHELTAIATYTSGDVMESVPLLVPSDGGTTETGTPMLDEDSSGCGCTSAGREGALGWLVLIGALAWRRRTPRR
jgi:MYXO-CTERM domain-containing protein